MVCCDRMDGQTHRINHAGIENATVVDPGLRPLPAQCERTDNLCDLCESSANSASR